MIKVILMVVVAAVTLVLGYAATQPSDFRVTRSAQIQAPPEKIFPLINDFQRWGAWSPYEKRDPPMQRTFSGPTSGAGAVYRHLVDARPERLPDQVDRRSSTWTT